MAEEQVHGTQRFLGLDKLHQDPLKIQVSH